MSYLNAQITQEEEGFLNKFIESFVTFDIILFYYSNPGSINSADDLAGRLGRKTDAVELALEKLVEKGILSFKETRTFAFEPRPEIKEDMDRFLSSLNALEKRLSVLNFLLHKESAGRKK